MKLSEFRKRFGEGTDFDLDWGKLAILSCASISLYKFPSTPPLKTERYWINIHGQ